MKTHKTNLGEGQWKVFVTDDKLDTYQAITVRESSPRSEEILEMFKSQREIFSLVDF